MAWQLKITPRTVARAYKLGIEEGLIEAQVGRGTYIRDPKPTRGTVFGETHVEPHIVDLRRAPAQLHEFLPRTGLSCIQPVRLSRGGFAQRVSVVST
ncbi:MAG: hypothetical protein ABGW81_03465 [Paracoccaceae bacterium]